MPYNQLNCSPRGRSLIQKFTGLRLKSFQDAAGVWTVGFGHTGADVTAETVVSQQQADDQLIKDLDVVCNGVNAMVTVKLSQNQFDALVSFAYEQGLHTLKTSTLIRLLNAGSYSAAADQFPRHTRSGGKELPMLLTRRNAERELFLAPY